MIKKILYVIIPIVIIIIIGDQFITNDDEGDIGEEEQGEMTYDYVPPEPGHTKKAVKNKINEIYAQAEEGKIPGVPFVLGETTEQEVTTQWGDPETVIEAESKNYSEYPSKHVHIGYQQDWIIDLRLYDEEELSDISLNDIEQMKGEADDIRYYQDDDFDQIILIYDVNKDYQLKLVFPNPTDENPNPVIHHTSLVTLVDINQLVLDEKIKNMSLDEKIGQMLFGGISGTSISAETRSLITDYKIGGIILYADNMGNPEQTVNLVNHLKTENSGNAFPMFIGVDQEGGDVSRLPGDLVSIPNANEIGIQNDPQFAFEIGELLAWQLRAYGFNLDFAPVFDVNSNPDNPIIGDRSFSDDANIVSELGMLTMKGLQSQNIIPVIKHFPGHGDTSADSHLELPIVNKGLDELKELELVPFEYAIKNGTDVIMIAHILLPELDPNLPSSMSKEVVTGVLREQLHYNGVIITDDMTMDGITDHYQIGPATVEAVKAGNDIILVAHEYQNIVAAFDAIKEAIKKGEISEERIDDSVRRIIGLKQEYELNDEQVPPVDIEKLNESAEAILE
ncbi:beta-N-acetylhexosaminidase [Oceanobacillus chungangensis]|nr:beta-N-acetylhexosaminidase [Oceanobacillus chungangensis]